MVEKKWIFFNFFSVFGKSYCDNSVYLYMERKYRPVRGKKKNNYKKTNSWRANIVSLPPSVKNYLDNIAFLIANEILMELEEKYSPNQNCKGKKGKTR